MIIAVDFDGTLCDDRFPEIGEPNLKLIEYLIKQSNLGNTLILWTCRTGIYLEEAINFCCKQGLKFDYINENTIEVRNRFGDARKVYADVYLDDRMGGIPHENSPVLPIGSSLWKMWEEHV